MKLTKIIPAALLAMSISLTMPAFAANETSVTPTETPASAAHVQQMMDRITEIKNMDKSNLSSSEKKELRKEVKSMKAEVRANRHGVYLTVGAAIIIVLLLIILL